MSISKQSSITANKWLLILLVLGIINVFASVIPLLVFAIIIIVVQLLSQKKEDWAFVFVLFSTVFGSYFAQQGLRGVGTILMLLGVTVLLPSLLKKGSLVSNSFLYSLILMLFLFLSVFISTGGNYATEKYSSTLLAAFLSFIAFGHLYLYPEKHNGESLSLMILLYAMFMLSYVTNVTGGISVYDVFTFGSFRENWSMARGDDIFIYNYQQIGFYACIGLCLYFYKRDSKIDINGWLLIVICGIIVLSCQARQSMFAYITSVVLLNLNLNRFKTSNILLVAGILLVVYYWLNSLDDWVLDFVIGQSEFESTSIRSLIHQTAINDFLSKPLTGIGYGRFMFENEYGVNEHNIVYEIMAETGIIGLLVFFSLSLLSIRKIKLNMFKSEYKWLLAILVTYVLRFMISSDLREGIGFFVILFLLPVIGRLSNFNQNNYLLRNK